ncbi:hypothetical protein MANES_08G061375v8 [Manihot esculenta]|uniref:Uncharacterized protein n=1 Tax=Manihot esculenta TaxID=3983 RepID=A0ACB7H9A3_MANES|nr:hypothetical protein MANES_08G061375v8 [Manihot esculenta]
MGVFCMHVRPPKEVWLATYKSPSDRKWASFLPILELRVFKLRSSFGSLEAQGVVSSHLQVRARTNPRSSRGSDPRNRGV